MHLLTVHFIVYTYTGGTEIYEVKQKQKIVFAIFKNFQKENLTPALTIPFHIHA